MPSKLCGDEEGMLLNLPRDKYPDLDKFEDILEAGTRVACGRKQHCHSFHVLNSTQ